MATTTAASLALRRLLQSSCRVRIIHKASSRKYKFDSVTPTASSVSSSVSSSSFSTIPDTNENNDPSNFVNGVSTADLEKDEKLQEYFAANFPAEFGDPEQSDDLYLDLESLGLVDPNADSDAAENDNDNTNDDDGKEKVIDVMSQQCDLAMNIRPLISYKRDKDTEEGSRQCRELRETTDMIPGILYGSDPPNAIRSLDPSSKILVKTPWNFIQRELDRFTYHNFESRVYDVTLFEHEDDEEGTVHRVMPRDVQFHPTLNKIYCCNYLRYFPGKIIKIPILYINEDESPAIKRGGFLAPFNRHVPCIVEDGVKIPEAIEMDFTGAKLKDVMRRDRLIFPEGVKPAPKVKEDFLLGTVFGRRSDAVEEAEEESEE
jgi:large subunit ribosomal protein L25